MFVVVIDNFDLESCTPMPEQQRKFTFSNFPMEFSLKSKPFPDMLLKLHPIIEILLLPVATETFVLQFRKLQSVSKIFPLAVALIAQIAEFSTEHRSNVMQDSETLSKHTSAIFSNLESFACNMPFGPKE
jgi:hypothetical protein